MSDGLRVSHTIINQDHILHGARLWVCAVIGGPRPFPFVEVRFKGVSFYTDSLSTCPFCLTSTRSRPETPKTKPFQLSFKNVCLFYEKVSKRKSVETRLCRMEGVRVRWVTAANIESSLVLLPRYQL